MFFETNIDGARRADITSRLTPTWLAPDLGIPAARC
jgi:hypothetical protein